MSRINPERKNLLLKIGIREGPCLAVILYDAHGLFWPDRQHRGTRPGTAILADDLRHQVDTQKF